MESRNIGLRSDLSDKEFVDVANRNSNIVAVTSDGLVSIAN
jgi:hypothetical protein